MAAGALEARWRWSPRQPRDRTGCIARRLARDGAVVAVGYAATSRRRGSRRGDRAGGRPWVRAARRTFGEHGRRRTGCRPPSTPRRATSTHPDGPGSTSWSATPRCRPARHAEADRGAVRPGLRGERARAAVPVQAGDRPAARRRPDRQHLERRRPDGAAGRSWPTSTKAAVDIFTLNLAKAARPARDHRQLDRPGPTDTDANASWQHERRGRGVPASFAALGQVGQPQDIADVVAFLASRTGAG